MRIAVDTTVYAARDLRGLTLLRRCSTWPSNGLFWLASYWQYLAAVGLDGTSGKPSLRRVSLPT